MDIRETKRRSARCEECGEQACLLAQVGKQLLLLCRVCAAEHTEQLRQYITRTSK